MFKREEIIKLIGEAVLKLVPYICDEDLDRIMREHDIAVDDPNGGLLALDMWDTRSMDSYEHTVRIVAEENNLTHITDPYFKKLEEAQERD